MSDLPELDGAPDVTGDLDEVVHYARVDDWHRHFVGSDIRQLIGRCQRAEAEVKRIRSIAYDPTYDHMEDENKRLKADVERLRGLLENEAREHNVHPKCFAQGCCCRVLSAEIDELQQWRDEVIVALGSKGLLPSDVLTEIERIRNSESILGDAVLSRDAEVERLLGLEMYLCNFDTITSERGGTQTVISMLQEFKDRNARTGGDV